MTAPLVPTHTVPAGGLATWPTPDPTAQPGPRLDAGLPVAVVETRGDWAHIVASNGFQAWVDARHLISGAAPPVISPPAAAGAPAATSRGGGGCLRGCLVLVLVVVVAVAGTLWAFSSRVITVDGLLALAGRGPGHVTVSNFRDGAVDVVLRPLNEDATGSNASLGPLDAAVLRASEPGRFELTATQKGTAVATCTLTVKSGDKLSFLLLPTTAVVRREGATVTSGAELIASTSSLCR